MQESLRLDLMFCRTRITEYANCKRLKGPTLKGGDKVYLLRRNIRSNKPTRKLDVVKLGPFRVRQKKGLVSYKLELPKRMRIYLVFYISLLEPAAPDATLKQDIRDIDPEIQEEIYEVERIIDMRSKKGQKQYLVR
jgi:hypothetical protein